MLQLLQRTLGLAALALLLLAGPAAGEVRAEQPMNLGSQITDQAQVLDDQPGLTTHLEDLRQRTGLQLFVVYVDTFEGSSGDEWAARTYATSGMGGDDVLLAVAVQDRRYGTYATGESGLTPADDQRVRSDFIEPALSAEDWDGAVRAAVKGYGEALQGGGSDGGGGFGVGWLALPLLLPLLFLAVPFLVVLWVLRSARHWGSGGRPAARRPMASPRPAAPDIGELRSRAATALVAMDDALRSSAEELEFAEAQFGTPATQRFRDALSTARDQAATAFRLQREVDDDVSGRLRGEGARGHYEQIIALAEQVDQGLDAEAAEFERLRDLEARVPEFLGDLGMRVQEVRRRLPVAEQELAGLAATYPAPALQSVSGAVEQATRLLDSADELLASGWQHLARTAPTGAPGSPAREENRPAAVAAARAAEDAIGQADGLLASVGQARSDLATAKDRIGPAMASLQSDIDDAARLGADDPVTTAALEAARDAIAAGSSARTDGDPLTALRTLTKAEHDLDTALARYREGEQQRSRTRQLLAQRFTEVHALLEHVDRTLTRYRGAVGPRARMLLSEAIREYDEARGLVDTDADAAARELDSAEDLAEQANDAAQDDLSSWHGGGYGGGYGRRGGVDLGSVILGGILAGSIGRGGGWGGSGGGWGGGGFGGGGSFGGGGGFGGGGRF